MLQPIIIAGRIYLAKLKDKFWAPGTYPKIGSKHFPRLKEWGKNRSVQVFKNKLETTDIYHFEKLLENFLEECSEDDDVKDFGLYFQKNYANRCKLWAYCHRLYAGINTTNMYLEAFHKVLKHIYIHGKVNKRIEMCVSYLLCFIRDKTFERYKNLKTLPKTFRIFITDIEVRYKWQTLLNHLRMGGK